MGLDSRLDENGNPLPAKVYSALQAGNQSDGGYNTNVLMLLHLPAGGGKAVGISIPRDDYVALPGHPDGTSMAKIKEAYGLTLDQKLRQLVNAGGISHADAYQQARAAARQAEVATVSAFLGGVPINHFVEVTMAAFYQVAQAVQPITVCLDEATSDTFSGANFRAGVQQLSASQAVSFVRQRRDNTHPNLDFTDLDRERRQQAFIISLAYKLKQAGTFTNLGTLRSLIDTAKQNIALDSGFNLLSFAGEASKLAGGNLSFTTLPITGFGVRNGQDVNLVNLAQIRAETARLLSGTPAPSSAAAGTSTGSGGKSTGGAGTGSTRAGTTGTTTSTSHGTTGAAASSSAAQGPDAATSTPLQSSGIPCVK
ncbi:LCP family protein [Cellulomonas sp. P24]|uniref:LCP family protein n=1 Tax=Cellulomonas sp. P24 TaxID=2885206 RepID=UPI00216AB321|nr:LCP family protein [Cellulomonas sp. P24]MCR6492550.1 LCP family protein [Cellulomonas sp. P24]